MLVIGYCQIGPDNTSKLQRHLDTAFITVHVKFVVAPGIMSISHIAALILLSTAGQTNHTI